MTSPLTKKLEKALGSAVTGARPMRGGDIADVSCLRLADGRTVVAKRPRADQPDTTAVEADMLAHLRARSALPVPDVLFQDKGILVINHIPHQGITAAADAAASVATHVAALHRVTAQKDNYYGYETDTVIGPLPQQNKPSAGWVDFFRERRLRAMATSCLRTGKIDRAFMDRVDKLANRLPSLIPATPAASLLHGDLWAGNMLIDGNTAAGFIDPAISYGHREMDLAFIRLMGGLDARFFDVYHADYPIEPGFHEERCALYQLWPLLVHVRLFGGGYARHVDRILTQFGC
jgi:fructosamine-3-kinase